MSSSNHSPSAAEEFNQWAKRADGAQVTAAWLEGLSALRGLMCVRLREDVEENFGLDSLQLPTSPLETERRLELEIAIYQAAVSALFARERKQLTGDAAWLAEWLARLQDPTALSEPAGRDRLSHYLRVTRQEQRHLFSGAIGRIMPAANRAPLVLFRLFPAAVRIITATALGDARGAEELRTQQRNILPAIEDCAQCHAAVLPNGHVCTLCSNPLWGYRFLTAAD
ncbi:MAG: hypothetical protein KY475_23630 [Planctomycetes bacterium]|nr:hypothetical protein [Planctomycetota bacterium]